MMQRSTLLFVFMAMGVGLGLFQLKYQVMNLEQDHKRIRKVIHETDEAIHILQAEWAHLNDPQRLQILCERHLTVLPIQGIQMISSQQVIGEESEGASKYDRGAMDQLVATLASDAKLTSLTE